ncbi:RagB/SusD family nutrient uptake outer membrane protein [Hymenobacter tenuis]
MGTFSCKEELLDPQPRTSIFSEVAFDTPTRIALQVNNLYDYVKSGSFLGGRYQVYGDIRADDFLNRTSNLVTGAAVWNHTLTEASQNDVISLWGAAYQAINQINVFLAGMEANSAKFVAPAFPATFAATSLNYQGEARLLRALSYYSLLQYYARPYADGNGSKPGVPLRLQAETGQDNNDLARATVAQVYDQILADLNFAEQNLPLTQGAAAQNISRAHRNTAIALKTRVYLSMGRYADVITEANKIVSEAAPFSATSGVAHALNPSIAAVFATGSASSELILAFPFTAQDAPGTQNQLGYYYNAPLPAGAGGNGEYSLNTSGILANPAFAATDARRTALMTTFGTEVYLKKYAAPSPFTDNAPVIRYSEVLLNLAEALARTGGSETRALALLNAVRGRSNPDGVYTAESFTSPTALVDAILLERRIEFLGEGIRNSDIMRLLVPIPGKGSVSAVQPTETLYIWPIPSTELQTNKLVTRN